MGTNDDPGVTRPAIRAWTVASAVIEEGPDAVLLVQNLRRNGTADWTTPGGVVDDGEEVLDGLVREVVEETGLTVTGWSGLLYEIEAEAPDLGWTLRVEVHRAAGVQGELAVGADPDGIVIGSAWAAPDECGRLLDRAHPWVREPLLDWLALRWETPRTYRYEITGSSLEQMTVHRR